MPTRMERLEESLKKEQHKADTKRLKKAHQYLQLGLAVLKDLFHNEDNSVLASEIFSALDKPMAELEVYSKS